MQNVRNEVLFTPLSHAGESDDHVKMQEVAE